MMVCDNVEFDFHKNGGDDENENCEYCRKVMDLFTFRPCQHCDMQTVPKTSRTSQK